MTRQGVLTHEVTTPQHRHNRLFAAVRQHRELDRAFLKIQDGVGRIALGENDVGALIGLECLPRACGTEEGFHVEPWLPRDHHDRCVIGGVVLLNTAGCQTRYQRVAAACSISATVFAASPAREFAF